MVYALPTGSFAKSIRHMSSTRGSVLSLTSMNQNLRQMEYAVRGLVPMTAEKIQTKLATDPSAYPFDEVLFCNIGNPQSVGQPSLSFVRQVTALVDCPELMKNPNLNLDPYVVKRAEDCIIELGNGTGAYSNSQGVKAFREHVSSFIQKRDESTISPQSPTHKVDYSCDVDNLFLSNGASSAIQMLLNALIASPDCGVLIPVPQYPIYSALTKLLNGQFVGYNLTESSNWGLDLDSLKSTIHDAKQKGVSLRAIVVINPGNPVGNVLSYEDITKVIKLCKEENLVLLADEVYQENIYSDRPFVSCKKVLKDMGDEFSCVELASFHSTSKGFIGECGKRGGYMELCNFDPDFKAQLVKLASSGLCSNLIGQLVTSLMVNPPEESSNSEAFKQYEHEKNTIMSSLRRKSKMLYEKLNAIEGVSCQRLDGAMYAFPKLELSDAFIKEAESEGQSPDTKYALSLLESTGLCVVPGSGFGQEEGTYHVRMTFLPPEEKLEKAMDGFAEHHRRTQGITSKF